MMYLGANPVSVNNTYYDSSIIAPDYSELTFPVAAGEYCIQNKKYYKAKQDISTSEEWTAAHWDETTVSEAIDSKVSKDSLDNAGITARTYTTKFGGEFTVTTASASGYISPYKRASVTGRIDKRYLHRVTVNGTEYILRTRLWYSATNGNIKVYEYLGNLGLYISDISGVPGGTDNVPFVIISDLNNSSSLDVLTSAAGTYTIKVEQINNTQTSLPKSLIWDDSYVPVEKLNNGGTYNGFSAGVNELISARGTAAIGYGNKVSSEFSIALGTANNLNCSSSTAVGSGNTLVGINSMTHSNYIEGYLNSFTNTGLVNHIEGMSNSCTYTVSNIHIEGARNTIASGSAGGAHVEGMNNVVNAGISHVEGSNNIANGGLIHIQGTYNVADSTLPEWVANTTYYVGDRVRVPFDIDHPTNPYGNFICTEENSDSTFTSSHWRKAQTNGDTAFIIGNGTADDSRSNAIKIDWDGNIFANGKLRVNCNADSSGGTIVPIDVQVNGTSVVSNGVANVPIGGASTYGVFRAASEAEVKAGASGQRVVTPLRQGNAVFYGMATAAGDSTQSASSNAVGTYTESAKSAIFQMLDAPETVSGSTPSITAKAGIRYVCGECSTLSFTPSATGDCEVIFESGSTATVLTLPNTVKMPDWFDATNLEANRTYDIIITDGVYGVVCSWA